MGWYPIAIDQDDSSFVFPRPVTSVAFSGGNKVTSSVVPLIAGTLVSNVTRDKGTLTISGTLVGSPLAPTIITPDDLYEARTALMAYFLRSNKRYRVYIAHPGYGSGITGYVFCDGCRCSTPSFSESIIGHISQTYSVSFDVPDGLIRYEYSL